MSTVLWMHNCMTEVKERHKGGTCGISNGMHEKVWHYVCVCVTPLIRVSEISVILVNAGDYYRHVNYS